MIIPEMTVSIKIFSEFWTYTDQTFLHHFYKTLKLMFFRFSFIIKHPKSFFRSIHAFPCGVFNIAFTLEYKLILKLWEKQHSSYPNHQTRKAATWTVQQNIPVPREDRASSLTSFIQALRFQKISLSILKLVGVQLMNVYFKSSCLFQ